MGNHNSGERRHKHGDSRMEGQAITIEKYKSNKQLHSQVSEELANTMPTLKAVFHAPLDGKDSLDPVQPRPTPFLVQTNKKLLPYVIKWNGAGEEVAIAGNFNNWQPITMVKSEKNFVAIVDLPEGNHEFKFLVDGEWKVNKDENYNAAKVQDKNVIEIKKSHFEELENQLLSDPNDEKESPYGGSAKNTTSSKAPAKDVYNQVIPDTPSRTHDPQLLPQHLMQVILNKDTPVSCEPTLLPEPNHVMLNHMYALSIRDHLMVLSTSHRYRKKCVTTLIYRPI